MFDEKWNIEDHVFGIALLSEFAIDGGGEAEVHGIGNVGGVDEKRADGGSMIAAFDAEVGTVVVFEIVADGVVVGDGVTGDEVMGALTRDRTGGFAYDNS